MSFKSIFVASCIVTASAPALAAPITVTVGGTDYTVQGLVGFGRLDAATRDVFGETFGSVSGLAPNTASWTRTGDSYSGSFYALPDRGFNIGGTTDYDARINILDMRFTPVPLGGDGSAQNSIQLTLANSFKLFEALPAGGAQPLTGLDAVPGGVAAGGARPALPGQAELPQASNGKLSLDAEAIVPLADGGYLVSDEYGPSVYRFDATGRFVAAFPVAESVRPIRGGVTDYSSNNAATGEPAPTPGQPTYGRTNNQGFEGMSLAPDGKTLIVMLQSAAREDQNTSSTNTSRENVRVFTYDISDIDNPVLTGEYVAQLPVYLNASGVRRIAAQSEILALSDTRFLILPRDGNGQGSSPATSDYRQVDIVDFASATNILGTPAAVQVAPGGVLNPGIVPATLTPWLDINDDTELARFGLRNGEPNDANNLSEKWEGLALLPTLEIGLPDDYFLFVANDNDFLTTNGFQVGQSYDAGQDLDTMFLAYRVTVPGLRAAETVSEPGMLGLLALGLGALAGLRRKRR